MRKPVSLTLPQELLAQVDALAGQAKSRSGAIEALLRLALAQSHGQAQAEEALALAKAVAQALERVEVLIRALIVLQAPDREALEKAVAQAKAQVERLKAQA